MDDVQLEHRPIHDGADVRELLTEAVAICDDVIGNGAYGDATLAAVLSQLGMVATITRQLQRVGFDPAMAASLGLPKGRH